MTGRETWVPDSDVTTMDCDLALGGYMRVWDRLHMATSEIFRTLLDAAPATANAFLHSNMGFQTLREVTLALGSHRLSEEDQKALEKLMGRAKSAATVRNRIVHGHWTLYIDIKKDRKTGKETGRKATWKRIYMPHDPSDVDKMMSRKDQKLKSGHQFTVEKIIKQAEELSALARDIELLHKSLRLLPARIPQPIDID